MNKFHGKLARATPEWGERSPRRDPRVNSGVASDALPRRTVWYSPAQACCTSGGGDADHTTGPIGKVPPIVPFPSCPRELSPKQNCRKARHATTPRVCAHEGQLAASANDENLQAARSIEARRKEDKIAKHFQLNSALNRAKDAHRQVNSAEHESWSRRAVGADVC